MAFSTIHTIRERSIAIISFDFESPIYVTLKRLSRKRKES